MYDETARDAGHNVFLHFLNRDSRQIFDLYRHIPKAVHLQVLGNVLNLAIFITRDYCIMPPGFLAEDSFVREILEIKRVFRDERLILLPMRESLDEYWAKKEREYASVRGQYSGLFSREGHKFVERNSHLLIDRRFVVGSKLLAQWEAAPDSSGYWLERYRTFAPSVIEIFRRTPRNIADDGGAVTWRAISERIPEVAGRHPEYRHLVQNIYLGTYVQSLDLRIVTGLPYARDDFGLGSGDLFYDYGAMRTLITPSGLWDDLLAMPAADVVALRKTPGYFKFRYAARRLIDKCRDYYELKRHLALPEADLRLIRAATSDADENRRGQLLLPYDDVNGTLVEAFGDRIGRVAHLALERSDAGTTRPASRRSAHDSFKSSKKESTAMTTAPRSNITVAVFAALAEERRILARELGFTSVAGEPTILRGTLPDGTNALLYGGKLMGRVPAAVETGYLLADHAEITVILVAGLAGGFPEKDVQLGHLIVPFQVADLASRKVSSLDDTTDSRVRPQAFELDQRFGRYLDTQASAEWLREACDKYDWPLDRRPMLQIGGSMVCLDEVVADNAYREKLQTVWGGQLLGVEMESGGVIAAARRFRGLALPVFQIRAVSDASDPAKSDDKWRRLGMQTISSIVSRISWAEVLNAK
jgi:nucleoside phosphorylase